MKVKLFLLSLFLQVSIYSQQLELIQPVRFLALGDSYTTGIGIDPDQNWPEQLFSRLSESGFRTGKIQILAQAGWTTDDLTGAIKREDLENDFNLVALLIGVNNQYQGVSLDIYEKEFEELLISSINLAQGRKEGVFVISIPDYAYTPFGNRQSGISNEIDLYNIVNSKIARKYGVTYFDLTFISRLGLESPELIAIDKLHPSALMYELWVDKIMDHINAYNTIQGIEDRTFVSAGMNLFPNPATDHISVKIISSAISSNSTLSIYTLSGILVFREYDLQFKLSDVITLALPEMNEGIYLVELVSDSEKLVSKMIIRESY